jgi:hypothetical protein
MEETDYFEFPILRRISDSYVNIVDINDAEMFATAFMSPEFQALSIDWAHAHHFTNASDIIKGEDGEDKLLLHPELFHVLLTFVHKDFLFESARIMLKRNEGRLAQLRELNTIKMFVSATSILVNTYGCNKATLVDLYKQYCELNGQFCMSDYLFLKYILKICTIYYQPNGCRMYVANENIDFLKNGVKFYMMSQYYNKKFEYEGYKKYCYDYGAPLICEHSFADVVFSVRQ